MESAAAQATMGVLIGKIDSMIQNEISMIGSLPDQLGELRQELIFMRSFLEDARSKRGDLTNLERSWVESIRDKSMEVEDVIDEYLYHKTRQLSRCKLLQQTVYLPINIWEKRQIAKEMQKIKAEIRTIRQTAQQYGMDHIKGCTSGIGHENNNEWLQNRAESSLFFKDEDLVGIDDDRKAILRWLTDGEPQREVMSVVGMGGSGKTTLVASAYRSQIVKRQFDCYAWITVSQKYTVDELLKRMIKKLFSAVKEEVPFNLGTVGYTELVDSLVSFLEEKRYVVVLDDVWSIDLWDDIKVSLPDNGRGSRVLLTTRQEDIGTTSFGVRSHLYKVKPLKMDEAMLLFYKKAFSSNREYYCPPELQILAQELIEKCKGLPLAIVALGGAMSSKKIEIEWRRVNDNLDFELKNNPALDRMKCILLLSYHALPYQLKRCFLYCCLFPEDHEIHERRLIRLWMAEGFIEKERGMTPEDVAENYLEELVRRNIVQVVRMDFDKPLWRRYKMHDLMREVGLSISREEKFCDIYYGQESSVEDIDSKTRLLSIQTKDQKNLEARMSTMSRLRSVLLLSTGKASPLLIKTTLSSCCRYMRVLDLEAVEIVELPSKIGDLFNLRYLNLSRTKVKELPKSIGRLRNLQTLNISDTEIQVLPFGISKLQNLRHLLAYNSTSREQVFSGGFESHGVPQVPSTIYKLKNLQVLDGVQADAKFMKNFREMTQLKSLRITRVRATHEEDLCVAIQSMNLLRHLKLLAIDEEYLPTMDAVSVAPSRLEFLCLYGKLEKLPNWFRTLESLRQLNLEWCRLTSDPLPCIQHLPNLVLLFLNNAYVGNKLSFGAGFQNLKSLLLVNLPHVEEIIIEKGAMPGLKTLRLRKVTMLKTLPHGIEHLSNLEILGLRDVSNELVERIRCVDNPKVEHIPEIHHFYRSPSDSKYCYENLS